MFTLSVFESFLVFTPLNYTWRIIAKRHHHHHRHHPQLRSHFGSQHFEHHGLSKVAVCEKGQQSQSALDLYIRRHAAQRPRTMTPQTARRWALARRDSSPNLDFSIRHEMRRRDLAPWHHKELGDQRLREETAVPSWTLLYDTRCRAETTHLDSSTNNSAISAFDKLQCIYWTKCGTESCHLSVNSLSFSIHHSTIACLSLSFHFRPGLGEKM